MTRATDIAWVSGCKATGYTLQIAPRPETFDFRPLNGVQFANFAAAQTIAKAIRQFVKGTKS